MSLISNLKYTKVPNGGYDAAVRELNEAKDTSFGRLNDYIKTENNLMKRVAERANEQSAARGLNNSSISIANAQGAVIDRMGEYAKHDSELSLKQALANQDAINTSSKTGSENRNRIATANIQKEATLGSAEISANAQIKATQMRNKAEAERQRSINETNILLQDKQDKAAGLRLKDQLASNEKISTDDRLSREQVAAEDRASQERIHADNRASNEAIAEGDRVAREHLQKMTIDSTEKIENSKLEYERTRDKTSAADAAYADYLAGVSNIDINASAESQKAQLDRLSEGLTLRMQHLETMHSTGVAYDPGFISPSANKTDYEIQQEEKVSQVEVKTETQSTTAQRTAQNPYPPRTNPWKEWQQRNRLPTDYYLATRG